METELIGIATILGVAIVGEWLAWRFGLPSILLLLLGGFAAGTIVDPDAIFGDLLMPLVSVSVAIILFEGGLTLRLQDLRESGRMVRNLISVGILITWAIAGVASHYLLGLSVPVSVLFGAILVVTGPTVIGPLLRHIRPRGQVGPILKWEGMLNDAVGAVLAVLVFEAIVQEGAGGVPAHFIVGVLKTLLVGITLGTVAALLLVLLLRRHWVPEHLHNAATFSLVIAVFTLSNRFQPEAGLLTVTLMGVVMANQRLVTVRHLVEFKENLRTLLLSFLFVMLAARIEVYALLDVGWRSILFLLVLMLIARPAAIFACAVGSNLTMKERLFLSLMAPRGIVAAAVTSIFALRLGDDIPGAELMLPAMFLVIIVTVTVYGLASRPLARWLDLAQPNPQGVLIVGAHALAREVALALQREGVSVRLMDNNRANIVTARMQNVAAHFADALEEQSVEDMALYDAGKLLAFTANDQVNTLAALNFAELFGKSEVYQLSAGPQAAPALDDKGLPKHLRGRPLFGKGVSYWNLMDRFEKGAKVKATPLSEEFTFSSFVKQYGDLAVPMFILSEGGKLSVVTAEKEIKPGPGQKIISLVGPEPA